MRGSLPQCRRLFLGHKRSIISGSNRPEQGLVGPATLLHCATTYITKPQPLILQRLLRSGLSRNPIRGSVGLDLTLFSASPRPNSCSQQICQLVLSSCRSARRLDCLLVVSRPLQRIWL